MRTLLVLLALAAPTVAADFDSAKLDAIRGRFEKFVADGEIAGAVTVVGSSNGVAHLAAVGNRRLGPDEKMTTDTLFRIASMTKPIIAVGIQVLAEDGKLRVTDPVEKHLPEFRGQWLVAERGKDRLVLKRPARPITIRDLLTHTSGLPGGYPGALSSLYSTRDRSLAESTLVIAQQPLEFEPGTRWAYCNAGIDTLGRIIEVTSGDSCEGFLSKRVFQPLGMKATTFAPPGKPLQNCAHLYALKGGKLVDAGFTLLGPTAKSRHPIPAGGLYSTGPDVARFYRMMLSGGSLDGKRVLSRDGVKEMTTVHTGELKCGFTDGMGFGHGFAVVRKPEGVTAMLSAGSFGHGGAFGTQSWADPKQDVFCILLIQRTGLRNGDASPMRHELQRLAVEAIRR